MRPDMFYPSALGEGRILLLIDRFTTPKKCLEGRTKLAKLDFFLRYPSYLSKALDIIGAGPIATSETESDNIESRMIRFRYGPWDPAYFSILGSLIGRGLVLPVKITNGIGYRTSEMGHKTAETLSLHPAWQDISDNASLLKKFLNKSGNTLRKFIYQNFQEIVGAEMGEII